MAKLNSTPLLQILEITFAKQELEISSAKGMLEKLVPPGGGVRDDLAY